MKKQPFCNFVLCGVSLTDFGLMIPSPFNSLELANSEQTSTTSWTLTCTVGGDANKKANIAAFEALLYSAAQATSRYSDAKGVPVSFMFGWLKSDGSVDTYLSYQGWTLQFEVSTTGIYMVYKVKGLAELAVESSMPVLNIPELSGIVQPSAVVEALAIGTKATSYYMLDIDHSDAPTYVSHGYMSTSFNSYVRGTYSGVSDDYDTFPGLLKLSKSYNGSREAAGLNYPYKKLSHILNHVVDTPIADFLKPSNTDMSPQCSSFSYWVDEPTMTHPGVIHYKSNASLLTNRAADTLEYGTANTNVLSVNGSYNGVTYNMTNINFSSVGFTLDASGKSILQNTKVVNSWSNSLENVFQTVDIINDLNGLATQFSGNFQVVIPGSVKRYSIAQPVSLLVMSGNKVSPITGVYNIISVGHVINATFITTLKLQRLVMSSANQVATSQNLLVNGSAQYLNQSVHTTSNVISPYKVDFGVMYPTFEHMTQII